MLTVEFLKALHEKGLTLADAIELIEAAGMGRRSSAAERQARYRGRKQASDVTESVTRDVTRDVTPPPPPETVSPTPPSTQPPPPPKENPPKGGQKKGALLPFPDDFRLEEALEIARASRALPPDRAKAEFLNFRDHARATGRSMQDWRAAWRMWCRKSVSFAPRGNGATTQKYAI
jgi:hypothetical protein